MLFNTLDYARFFALVFVAAWLLSNRRLSLALPWFAVGGFAAFGPPSVENGVIAAVALVLTAALCRTNTGERPSWTAAAASVTANVGLLCLAVARTHGTDPFTLALRSLKVPVGSGPGWSVPLGVALSLLGVAVVRAKKVRLFLLLGASYVFYAHWDYRFLPLIFGSSTIDWLLGNAIARAPTRAAKRRWLVVTVVLNLGVLALFKYFDFGVESAATALRALGLPAPDIALRVALPVGISFFTFESMSYVIDVYRGDIEPHPSYAEYLTFVAFFPHLVAGPIVRPRDLLPQLAGSPRFRAEEGSQALFLIAVGLVKKVAIGDYLALNLVDRVFDAPAQYSALECYAAVVGYALQIYCDFSGYTDIAIGSALLLGVRFPKNFDAPYKALSIQDFWRRWHISLSTWLRDYLYVPLGGNRKGPIRTYVNLMLTMLLGGLWHGASWTFVVWGGLHGAALAITRALRQWTGATEATSRGTFYRVFAWFVTFHFVCAAWVFFRADTFSKAAAIFSQLSSFTTFRGNLPPEVVAVLALGLASHLLPERWYERVRDAFVELPAPAQGLALFGAALVLRRMASAEAVPFVYFQF